MAPGRLWAIYGPEQLDDLVGAHRHYQPTVHLGRQPPRGGQRSPPYFAMLCYRECTRWPTSEPPSQALAPYSSIYDPVLVADQALVSDAVETDLMPIVKALYEDFYKSEARHTAPTLKEMGEQAALEFRLRHPEISDDAVIALAWCYTYDYKSLRQPAWCERGRAC